MKGLFQCPPWARSFCPFRACGAHLRNLSKEPTLKSKACFKYLYFTKIISDLCCYLEYFSYLYTIN